MAISWSNPNPSEATAAALGNAAHIQPIDIGSIVAGIMRMREQEAARQQEQQQQTMAAVAKGVSGVEQGIQQGNANDAANATMYGIQYPNDPYGGFNDPNKVPDYGGTSALKMLESARQMGFETPEQKALADEKMNLLQAQEYKDWNGGGSKASGSLNSPIVDPNTGLIFNGRQWVKPPQDPLTSKYGITPDTDLGDASQLTRVDRSGKPDPSGDYVNIGGTRDYSQGDNPPVVGGQKIPFNAYVAAAAKRGNTPSLPSGIRQDDVSQAAGAVGRGEGGEPIQGSTTSSTTPDRQGAGPNDAAIAYLKAHPDLAAQFDAKYGHGAAATYLTQ